MVLIKIPAYGLGIFLRGKAVLCPECPVKAGIIPKATHAKDFVWLFPLRQQLPGDHQSLFLNVPVQARADLPVKFMAEMVFADGDRNLEEAAQDLMKLVLETASGRKTKAEEKDFREIAIFKDGIML